MKNWLKWLLGGVLVLVALIVVVAVWAWHLVAGGGKRYLILLQNTDEVRATGGFLGSYAVLDFGNPNPLDMTIRDMYDPSGVSQVLPAPPGHAEYLSEGNGLRLVDANWQPDFPSAAQLILQYFAAIPGDPQTYDGLIAVPLSAIEKIFSALGGVYVADQQQTVTAETLAELARQDRAEFFPGSKDKTQSLQGFYTALKLRLTELSFSEWRTLWRQLSEQNIKQEIQVYARDTRLQAWVRRLELDGALEAYGPNDVYLFPVESNVGINKANRKITRSLATHLNDDQLTVTTVFQNYFKLSERPNLPENSAYNVAPHLAYINYYRLLVRPEMSINGVRVGDEELSQWDEELITSAAGVSYRQLGFLVVVPEETTITAEVRLILPAMEEPRLQLQQQVGVVYQAVTSSIE